MLSVVEGKKDTLPSFNFSDLIVLCLLSVLDSALSF